MPAIWTAPRTWVSGEVVTASIMNTHVRDNLESLDTRIRTTFPGNIVSAGGAATTVTGTSWTQVLSLSQTYSYGSNHRLALWFMASWRRQTTFGELRFTFSVGGATLGSATFGIYYGASGPSSTIFNPMSVYTIVTRPPATSVVLMPMIATDAGNLDVGYAFTQFGFAVLPDGL